MPGRDEDSERGTVQRATVEPALLPASNADQLGRIAAARPSRLGAALRQIQRAYGNRHVLSVLQRAEDEEEQEPIRRAVTDEEEQEPVRRAEDEEEQEPIRRAVTDDEDKEPIRRAVADEEDKEPIRRAVADEEEEPVQRAPIGLGGGEVSSGIERSIEGARGGGQALDGRVRTQMEDAMGADFGGVRVHTGAEADRLNRQISAKAFTTGSDIFFRHGAYQPGSAGGRELLAHELTHVVQQGGGVRAKLTVGAAGDKYEDEADQVARAVMRQEQTVVQRQREEGITETAGSLPDSPVAKKLEQPDDLTLRKITAIALAESESEHTYGQEIAIGLFYYSQWIKSKEQGLSYSKTYQQDSSEYEKGLYRIFATALGGRAYVNEGAGDINRYNKEEEEREEKSKEKRRGKVKFIPVKNIGEYLRRLPYLKHTAQRTYEQLKQAIGEVIKDPTMLPAWTDQGSAEDYNIQSKDHSQMRQYFFLQEAGKVPQGPIKVLRAKHWKHVTFLVNMETVRKYFNAEKLPQIVPNFDKDNLKKYTGEPSSKESTAGAKQDVQRRSHLEMDEGRLNARPLATSNTPVVQRTCATCEEEATPAAIEERKIDQLTAGITLQRTVAVDGKVWSERQGKRFLETRLGKYPQIKRGMQPILSSMLSSDVEALEFASQDHLYQYMLRRYWLIKGMGVVGLGKCCGYPRPPLSPRVNLNARIYWQHVKDYEFALTKKGEAAPDLAIKALFTPQEKKRDRTLLDCTHMAVALHYFSLLQSIGSVAFKKLVRGGNITVAIISPLSNPVLGAEPGIPELAKTPQGEHFKPTSSKGIVSAYRSIDIEDLIIGDHVYFANHPTYVPLIKELRKRRHNMVCSAVTDRDSANCPDIWAGEHAVYMGKEGGEPVFQGHGTSRLTVGQMLEKLRRHYNCHVALAAKCTPPIKSVDNEPIHELAIKDIPGIIEIVFRPKEPG